MYTKLFAQKNIGVVVAVAFILASATTLLIDSFEEDFVITERTQNEYRSLEIPLQANVAAIYDLDEEVMLAGKQPYSPVSMASITKLTSALIASLYLHSDDTTEITEEDFLLSPTTSLQLGERWNAIHLLEYSLITSSNRGVNAIGRLIERKQGEPIVDLMNAFAQENGLVNTHFVNPTGLDIHSNLSGSESSAFDLVKLAEIFLERQPELAATTATKEQSFYSLAGTGYVATNTNLLLGSLEDTILLSKTGYTGIAGGALIMVIQTDLGKRIGLVVLGSTKSGRFEDMKKLIDFYHTELDSRTQLKRTI